MLSKTPQVQIGRERIAQAMREAITAARAYEGATAPNPPVGCVLLDAEGRAIATAAHHGAGQPHAEALAIAEARAQGRVSDIDTVVVTLEPCNHHGRTPPCSQAILATPAKRVVYGLADPNGAVKGGGAVALREAGLQVERFDGLQKELTRLLAPFAKRVTKGLPWVVVKQALDVSGSMIPPMGAKTFTSESSLRLAHELRRKADAILTGSGTVLADKPEFTVRHVPDFAGKKRQLIIMDRRGRVGADYVRAAEARGFAVVVAKELEAALKGVVAFGGLEVLVEAGPQLTQQVLQSPYWDEHVRISRQASGPDKIEIMERVQ